MINPNKKIPVTGFGTATVRMWDSFAKAKLADINRWAAEGDWSTVAWALGQHDSSSTFPAIVRALADEQDGVHEEAIAELKREAFLANNKQELAWLSELLEKYGANV